MIYANRPPLGACKANLRQISGASPSPALTRTGEIRPSAGSLAEFSAPLGLLFHFSSIAVTRARAARVHCQASPKDLIAKVASAATLLAASPALALVGTARNPLLSALGLEGRTLHACFMEDLSPVSLG